VFAYDGDIEVHLHLFRSALGRRRQILEYQVRQTPTGADIAIRTLAPLDGDALRQELLQDLTTAGIARPRAHKRVRAGGAFGPRHGDD
jgi:phenylacetate-CoA ligase